MYNTSGRRSSGGAGMRRSQWRSFSVFCWPSLFFGARPLAEYVYLSRRAMSTYARVRFYLSMTRSGGYEGLGGTKTRTTGVTQRREKAIRARCFILNMQLYCITNGAPQHSHRLYSQVSVYLRVDERVLDQLPHLLQNTRNTAQVVVPAAATRVQFVGMHCCLKTALSDGLVDKSYSTYMLQAGLFHTYTICLSPSFHDVMTIERHVPH